MLIIRSKTSRDKIPKTINQNNLKSRLGYATSISGRIIKGIIRGISVPGITKTTKKKILYRYKYKYFRNFQIGDRGDRGDL